LIAEGSPALTEIAADINYMLEDLGGEDNICCT
jgi:hypothetical protein